MYSQLYSCVKLRYGHITDYFNVCLGTRQGCNMSPTLFNLFINDLPSVLETCMGDPVSLGSEMINALMYADDLVLLSNSSSGMQNLLDKLNTYCLDWRLSLNFKKTKI